MVRTPAEVEEFKKMLSDMSITEILIFMSDRKLGDWGFLAMVRDELASRMETK
jgi:hypothetical protein